MALLGAVLQLRAVTADEPRAADAGVEPPPPSAAVPVSAAPAAVEGAPTAADADAAEDCQICLSPMTPSRQPLTLERCGHAFCADCVAGFVAAELDAGHAAALACPYTLPAAAEDGGGGDGGVCGLRLTDGDVEMAAVCASPGAGGGEALHAKYARLRAQALNPRLRTCPWCGAGGQEGDPSSPAMECGSCHRAFCYAHANAHPVPGMSCAQYAAATADDDRACAAAVAGDSRKCPGCGALVTKVAGCNHMQCPCGASFCWLCGRVIDASELPTHYAFWNLAGSANRQMADADGRRPSRCASACRTLKAALILVVFGPISLAMTVLSFTLGACWCVPAALRYEHGPLVWALTVLEIWHVVVMSVVAALLLLPLGVAAAAVACLLLPCFCLCRGGGGGDDAGQEYGGGGSQRVAARLQRRRQSAPSSSSSSATMTLPPGGAGAQPTAGVRTGASAAAAAASDGDVTAAAALPGGRVGRTSDDEEDPTATDGIASSAPPLVATVSGSGGATAPPLPPLAGRSASVASSRSVQSAPLVASSSRRGIVVELMDAVGPAGAVPPSVTVARVVSATFSQRSPPTAPPPQSVAAARSTSDGGGGGGFRATAPSAGPSSGSAV
jgi:hypothetical protein